MKRVTRSIASFFTSSSGEAAQPATAQALPNRLANLKKELWKDSLVQSWNKVLAALEVAVDEVSAKGGSVSVAIRMEKLTFHTSSLDHPSSHLCRNRQGIVCRTNYGHKRNWHSYCDRGRPEGSRLWFCLYDPWLTLSV